VHPMKLVTALVCFALVVSLVPLMANESGGRPGGCRGKGRVELPARECWLACCSK